MVSKLLYSLGIGKGVCCQVASGWPLLVRGVTCLLSCELQLPLPVALQPLGLSRNLDIAVMFCCVSQPAVVHDSPPYPNKRPPGEQLGQPGNNDAATKQPPHSPQAAVHCMATGELSGLADSSAGQVALQGSDYATLCRKLLAAVEALRNAGASAVLNLPQVVVCGNQSAGKSSVIEAICGISLPRSDGTCTRCPTEVYMNDAPGSSWQASVRIRREWDEQGARLPTPEITGVRMGITDPREVEGAVRSAQQMLLALDAPSSSQEPAALAVGTHARPSYGCEFSRNSIVVEVQGAPASLSLVDLPGIIYATEQRASQGGVDYHGLVNALVREYAGRPSSVIVAVLSCKEDMESQSILSLARELDPAGQRTLGVLTKPDAIEEGCHGNWCAVLQGKRWPLRLGYYMVRNPTQAQLNAGLSHAAARNAEAAFFTKPPWSSLGLGTATGTSAKLGTVSLRRQLSKLLVDLTASSMPHLLTDAQQQLAAVDAALERLPAALLPAAAQGNRTVVTAETEILLHRALAGLVEEVCTAVASLMSQQATCAWPVPSTTLALQHKPAATTVASSGRGTNSTTAVVATSAAAGPPHTPAHGLLWSQLMFDFTTFTQAVHSTRPSYIVNGVTFSSGSFSQATPLPNSNNASQQSFGKTRSQQQQQSADNPPGTLTLDDVKSLVESYRAMELPGFAPYSALQALVARCTASWAAAAEQLMASASRTVAEGVMAVLADRMARFPAAHKAARTAAHALLQQLSTSTAQQVRAVIAMETGAAFTMNRAEFESQSSSLLQQLRQAAERGVVATCNGTADAGGNHTPRSGALQVLSNEHVLTMMAVSITYFQLAARRVVDYVPLTLVHHLVSRFGVQLKTVLTSDLLAGKNSLAVAALLAEDESVAAQRQELQQQRSTLQAALDLIAFVMH